MADWDLRTEQVEVISWKRTWRLEFFTDLGSDFTMRAHPERVTTLPDGSVVHAVLPEVVRRASQVGADPRVQQLQALLTELVKEWLDADEAAATLADQQSGPVEEPPVS